MLEYSVIIRTTGKAGEKYIRLLDSIKALTPQPKEVIVVLPDGYELPQEKLGWETFYFCPKGMVKQRLYGIKKCKTPYALVSDDDIAFSNDFVNKLSIPVVTGQYGFSAGPLVEFFPQKGKSTFFSFIVGASMPTLFHRKRYNSVLKTTGYSLNRNITTSVSKLYETQSAPWTCFFADIKKLNSIHFEDEMWLDKNGYAAYDDQTMFYKAWCRGIKSVIVSDATYRHLDGKTSTTGINETASYASAFNMIVFWHRFIYKGSIFKKFLCKICFKYRLFAVSILNYTNYKRGKQKYEVYEASKQGRRDAQRWIKSYEYMSLGNVYRE